MAKIGRNEAFAINMIGAEINFDVQPYASGRMKITDIVERDVTVKEFCARRGTQTVTYSAFDVKGEVIEGTEVGALIAGVPVRETVKKLTGRMYTIVGCRYGEIYNAVMDGKIIVKATCG